MPSTTTVKMATKGRLIHATNVTKLFNGGAAEVGFWGGKPSLPSSCRTWRALYYWGPIVDIANIGDPWSYLESTLIASSSAELSIYIGKAQRIRAMYRKKVNSYNAAHCLALKIVLRQRIWPPGGQQAPRIAGSVGRQFHHTLISLPFLLCRSSPPLSVKVLSVISRLIPNYTFRKKIAK